MRYRARCVRWLSVTVTAAVLATLTAAAVSAVVSYPFATPIFSVAVGPDGSLLVADAGAGIVELRNGVGSLVAALPGVTDVAPIGRGDMFATRGGGPGLTTGALFRVSRGSSRQLADLYRFEAENNPHPAAVDSNPFDVEVLNGGRAIVADAGGNTLLTVDQQGRVDWIAVFPNELVFDGQYQEPGWVLNSLASAESRIRMRSAGDDARPSGVHERRDRSRWRVLRGRVEGIPCANG